MGNREPFHEPRERQVFGVNRYFAAAVSVIVGFIFLTLPSHSWRAEIYYESGTNFLSAAYHEDLLSNLWETDAGYLPWLQRVIAVTVVKGLGIVRYYPQVTALLTNFIDAMLLALFCLPVYRRIVANDRVRFLIAVSLGCGLVLYPGTYTLFNIPYFAVLILLALPFIPLNSLSLRGYLLHLVLVPLLILSKGPLVVFGPIYLVVGVLALIRQRRREVILFSVAGLAFLLQTATMLESKKDASKHGTSEYHGKGLTYPIYDPKGYINDISHFYRASYPFAFVRSVSSEGNEQLALILLLTFGCLLIEPIRQRDHRVVGFAFAALGVSFLNATLNIVAHPLGMVQTGLIHSAAISNISLFALTFVLVAYALREQNVLIPAILLLILMIAVNRPEPFQEHHGRGTESHSQWKIYHPLITTPDYAIPINDSPWFMKRDCEWLNFAHPLTVGQADVDVRGAIPWSERWSVRAVLFEQQPDQRTADLAAHVRAYDQSGQEVGIGKRLTRPDARYQYYWFPERVSLSHLRFCDAQGQPRVVHGSGMRFYGKQVSPE